VERGVGRAVAIDRSRSSLTLLMREDSRTMDVVLMSRSQATETWEATPNPNRKVLRTLRNKYFYGYQLLFCDSPQAALGMDGSDVTVDSSEELIKNNPASVRED
jgi:septum formation inhibitor-activating ATPase MinD